MTGIRRVYAWYEIWIDGDCVDVIRVEAPYSKNDLSTRQSVEHQFVNLTGRMPKYLSL